MKSTSLSIGDVAARFNLGTHVLRHWEDCGLLSPQRDSAGRRQYGQDDVVRIAAILANQSSGLSLDQIRTVFDGENWERHRLLEQHLVEIDRRQRELEVSRAMTQHALECHAHDLTTCPRFRETVEGLLSGAGVGDDTWRISGPRPERITPGPRSPR